MGRLDAFCDRQASIQLKEMVRGHEKVILDLSSCEFMSLQVLKLLSDLNQQKLSEGGELALLNLNHHIKKQIEIFLGTKAFRIYRDLRELNNGYMRHARSEHLNIYQMTPRVLY